MNQWKVVSDRLSCYRMSRLRLIGCVVVEYGCVVIFRFSDPERQRIVSSRLVVSC